MRWVLAAAAVVTAAALLARRSDTSQPWTLPDGWDGLPTSSDESTSELQPTWPSPWPSSQSSEQDQSNNQFEDIIVTLDPRNLIPLNVPPALMASRRRAILDTLAWCEDTASYGDNGYNVLFGHGLFNSYADHPRQYFWFTDKNGKRDKTSAAGRYQFILPTWEGVRDKLQLPDFGPASQDLAALELIREKGALRDVDAGRIETALNKIRRVWASLPGAGYHQGERSLARVLTIYAQVGGTFEGQA